MYYRHYVCYESYAIGSFILDNNNYTCEIYDNTYENHSDVSIKNYYKQDKQYKMCMEQNDNDYGYICTTSSKIRNLAIAGFVFLLLAAIVLICILFMCFVD